MFEVHVNWLAVYVESLPCRGVVGLVLTACSGPSNVFFQIQQDQVTTLGTRILVIARTM